MFERFTERARQVVVLAQDEARALKHDYVGAEHILLGLLREEEGFAARVLESLGITVEEVRAQVARIVGQGDEVTTGQMPLTARAQKALELALREALSLGHHYIDTEHILLGLVRENEGVAARILLDFDADAEKIRNEIVRTLSAAELPPSIRDEIDRVRAAKEAAMDAQEFERAADLRERQRELERSVRDPVARPIIAAPTVRPGEWSAMPRRRATYTDSPVHSRAGPPVAFLVGAATFAAGVLVGWLIAG